MIVWIDHYTIVSMSNQSMFFFTVSLLSISDRLTFTVELPRLLNST